MVCFRTISPFTDCQVIKTKRPVPQPTMTSPTWCYLRPWKRSHSSMFPLLDPNRKVLIRVFLAATDELKKKQDKIYLQWRPVAEVAKAGNRTDQLPVGGKLAHYQDHWKNLFPQHPEIVRKVSQGILIAFDDVPPSLLRYPLHLSSNDKTADLLHTVQTLQVSQAIEEAITAACFLS